MAEQWAGDPAQMAQAQVAAQAAAAQAAQTVQAVPRSNLVPGPIVLLLLLPAIPLLLFSVGARPLDISALPFSTDDLWQTTAFVTVAGAVVLSMAVYPGLLDDMSAWVTRGEVKLVDGGEYGAGAWGRTMGQLLTKWTGIHVGEGDSVQVQTSSRNGQAQVQIQSQGNAKRNNGPKYKVRYEKPEMVKKIKKRPASYRQDRNGNTFYRPPAQKVVMEPKGPGRVILEPVSGPRESIVRAVRWSRRRGLPFEKSEFPEDN